LYSFQVQDTKLDRFLAKNERVQRKNYILFKYLDGVMARIEKKGNLDFQPCILNKKTSSILLSKEHYLKI